VRRGGAVEVTLAVHAARDVGLTHRAKLSLASRCTRLPGQGLYADALTMDPGSKISAPARRMLFLRTDETAHHDVDTELP